MITNKSIIWIGFSLALALACTPGTEEKSPASPVSLDLEATDITQLQQGYQDRQYTIKEVVESCLARIDSLDPYLNAMIILNPDAIQIASRLDEEMANGQSRGPMHGIPVILKDNIDTHDKMPNTAGSLLLKDSYPLQDSWVAAKLRQSGAIILGKANLSEWANFHSSFSSSGWSPVAGQTNNPYDLSRNPCGSSSGSGVAVAASYSPVAIGTETWGSIVCPSNNNGIVGIKPTVGLISRSGIVPISFTQDTPGPMARSVRDAAICLGVLTGVDSTDSKTLPSAGNSHQNYAQFLDLKGLQGKRIGIYKKPLGQHFRVDTLFARAIRVMESQGAVFVEVEEMIDNQAGDNSFQVMLYEFKDGLNKYLESLGPNRQFKDMEALIKGTFANAVEMQYFDHQLMVRAQAKGDLKSKEYLQALNSMTRQSREEGIDRVMKEHNLDVIVAPTGGPAWKTDPINGDRFGVSSSGPAAWAGYPNISVPMGYIDGMPVGLSFLGKAWSEPVLLAIAYSYEQATKHRKPPEFIGAF